LSKYEGDVRDWKGKEKNTDNEAPAGSYYFVVEVKGWDNKYYNNNNMNSGSEIESEETSNQSLIKSGIVALYR
jgi:hypothetical protein